MLSIISDALDSYLQAQLQGNAIEVAWEGVAFDPQTNSPYLRVTLAAYTRVIGGPGPQTVFIERGAYSIVVVWPAGSGKAAPMGEADKIKALFPRGLSITLSGQAPLIVEQTSLAAATNDGDWLNIPVTIQWTTSEFGS